MAGEVRIEATEADYINAAVDAERRVLRRPINVLAWGAIGLGAALGSTHSLRSREPFLDGILLLGFNLLFLAAIVLLAYAVTLRLARRRESRTFRSQSSIQEPTRYSWSDEGLTLETERTTRFHPWSEFRAWSEGRASMMLYIRDRVFLFLPHRLLGHARAADLVATLRKAGVPNR